MTTAAELEILIDEYLVKLNAVSKEEFSFKPSPAKWSNKEIVGHLIDSAQNNIRRFIVAQYEDTPKIIYDQEKWVVINNYQNMEAADVIQLWYFLNKQIVSILKNTSAENAQRTSSSEDVHTIEWLATDYIKHLEHHMHVALKLEPVAYP
jgi:hypothetical protein